VRKGPRLVDILMRTGLVEEADLQRARARQESRGGSLLESVVLGGASEVDLARGLSGALRLPVVNLQGKRIDPEILELVPRAVAEKYSCLPLFTKTEQGMRTLYLGVEDPTDQAVLDDVSFRAGLRVRPVVVGPIQLRATLRASYPPPPVAEPVPVETRKPLAEAPIEPDDTAPVLMGVPSPVAEATSNASDASGQEPAPPEEPVRSKPRDVPTRIILRALLQVLIEKDVISRGELLAAVDDLRGPPGKDDSPH